MFIYLFIVALILIFKLDLTRYKNLIVYRNKENTYSNILFVIILFISTLRGSSVGTDTLGYMLSYYDMANYSFSDIFIKYGDYLGYYLPCKAFSLFNAPLQIWLGFVSGFYLLSIWKLINRFSTDKLFSILCFFLMGAYSFSLAGLKQTVAMASMIFAFLALYDKKYLRMAFFIIWAYFSHMSSLIFLFAIPIFFVKGMKSFYKMLIVSILIIIFSYRTILIYFTEAINSDRYMTYLEDEKVYSAVTFIFYLVLFFIAFLNKKSYDYKYENESKVFFALSALCVSFQTFSFVSASAFRLSLYYLPFFALILPNSVAYCNDKAKKQIIKLVLGLMIIFFFVYTNRNGSSTVPYTFIWEDPPFLK